MVTGGGHLEFPHEKWMKKTETIFAVLKGQNKRENTPQLFKFYMKK